MVRSDTPFVGRARELALLVDLLERAGTDDGRAGWIVGSAGSGKTSLLRRTVAEATRRGFEVVEVNAGPRGGGTRPFEPFRAALHRSLTGADDAAARRVARVLAAKGRVDPSRRVAETCDALRELFVRACDRSPLLVAIDDLDAADAATAAAVLFLIRHLRHHQVAIIVTGREASLAHDVADGGRRLLDDGRVDMVRLAPFDHVDLADLVRAHIGAAPDGEFVSGLHQRTGGLPFFVAELLDVLLAAGIDPTSARSAAGLAEMALPRRASTAVLHRVFELGADARTVASVAAVIGRSPVDITELDQLTGLSEQRAADAFDRLVGAGVFLEDGGEFTFAHSIVREALYGDLPPAGRRAWHARYAALLVERRSAAATRDILDIAEHLRSAGGGRDARTSELLGAAGDTVLYDDPAAAAQWYEAALARLAPTDDRVPVLQLAIGRALDLGGRHDASAKLTAAALERLPPGPDRERGAAAAARAAIVAGRLDLAQTLIDDGAPDGAPLDPILLLERGRLRCWNGDRRAADDLAAVRADALADALADVAPLADTLELQLALSSGGTQRAAALADRLRSRVGDLDEPLRASVQFGLHMAWALDLDPRCAVSDELLPAGGSTPSWRLGFAGHALWRMGRLGDAASAAAAALDPIAAPPSDLAAAIARAVTIRSCVEAGDLDAAAAAVAGAEVSGGSALPHLVDCAVARYHVARGEAAEATAVAGRALDAASKGSRVNVLAMCLATDVEVAVATGASVHARAANARLQRLDDDGGSVAVTMWLLMSQVLAARDQVAARAARDHAVRHGLALDAARALAMIGVLDGDRDALAAAEAEFVTIGALGAWHDVAGTARRSARRGSSRRRRSEVLSADERRITGLVAEGLTNREIARRMSLSAKTIEVYLSRIYAKTRCRSRVELALAVQRGGVAVAAPGADRAS